MQVEVCRTENLWIQIFRPSSAPEKKKLAGFISSGPVSFFASNKSSRSFSYEYVGLSTAGFLSWLDQGVHWMSLDFFLVRCFQYFLSKQLQDLFYALRVGFSILMHYIMGASYLSMTFYDSKQHH